MKTSRMDAHQQGPHSIKSTSDSLTNYQWESGRMDANLSVEFLFKSTTDCLQTMNEKKAKQTLIRKIVISNPHEITYLLLVKE